MKYRITTNGTRFRVERSCLGLLWRVAREVTKNNKTTWVVREDKESCLRWIMFHQDLRKASKWKTVVDVFTEP